MRAQQGFPVVLTADATLTAGYRLLFDGMLVSSLTTTSPPFLLSRLLLPPPSANGLRAPFAPLGLRRIEAALAEGGFTPDEVVVAAESGLADVIGPHTRAVGITTGEPAGHGMNSTTMTAVAGGHIYPRYYFDRLLARVRRLIADRAPGARVIIGGPGAWQLAKDSEEGDVDRQRVDHVVCGYAEGNAAEIFRAACDGNELPTYITGQAVQAVDIPVIRGAATMGVVEVSRGCGLGCNFCTLARVGMEHLSPKRIMADIEVNLQAGLTSQALISEDIFRYGGQGRSVCPEALIGLLADIRRHFPAMRLLQTDHANIASVAGFDDEQLSQVRELLTGETGAQYPWVNLGVESASGELLAAAGGAAKMGQTDPAQWGEWCALQVRRLSRAGFVPMVSLLLGLPGEQREHVAATLQWVRELADIPVMVFPLLYAPPDGGLPVTRSDLTRLHWTLIRTCYRYNFRWTPRMYADNQKAAGVSSWRRGLLQVMGHGQVAQWSALFRLHGWRAGS